MKGRAVAFFLIFALALGFFCAGGGLLWARRNDLALSGELALGERGGDILLRVAGARGGQLQQRNARARPAGHMIQPRAERLDLFRDQRRKIRNMHKIEHLFPAAPERHVAQCVCSVKMGGEPCKASPRSADFTAAVENHIVRHAPLLEMFRNSP